MKKIDSKEKILKAAFRILSEKGYLGTSTREIAKESGVAELTLFRHFGSKENLFEEVLKEYMFLPHLKEMLAALKDRPYEETLKEVGTRLLMFLKERKSLIRIMLSEINLYPDKIRVMHDKLINEGRRSLANYLSYKQIKGELRKFPPEVGARAFLGTIFSYFQMQEIIKRKTISKGEVDSFIKEFVEIMVRGTIKIRE